MFDNVQLTSKTEVQFKHKNLDPYSNTENETYESRSATIK